MGFFFLGCNTYVPKIPQWKKKDIIAFLTMLTCALIVEEQLWVKLLVT